MIANNQHADSFKVICLLKRSRLDYTYNKASHISLFAPPSLVLTTNKNITHPSQHRAFLTGLRLRVEANVKNMFVGDVYDPDAWLGKDKCKRSEVLAGEMLTL